MLTYALVGGPGPDAAGEDLKQFIALTKVDEVMVASAIFDHAARLRSYEILSKVHNAPIMREAAI